MPDDATLLRRYATERAEDAFAELVRRHVDGVYSAALRRVGGDAHLAEDVTQQVFVALARKAAALVGHPVLSAELYRTTRNEAANLVRHERRRKRRELEAGTMEELLAPTNTRADWSRVAPVLDAAIDELNERDREAILLRFVDRLGFSEMGAALRLTEDAARIRVKRSLEKLRVLLTQRGVTSTGTALGLALANHALAAAPSGLAASVTGSVALSANAATSPVVAFLQLMSASKIALTVAGTLLVLAVGIATRESSNRRAAEAALNAADQSYVAQIAKQRALEQRAQASERDAAQLRETIDETRTKEAGSMARTALEAQAPKAAPAWDPVAEGQAFLARHPEVKKALIERAKASVRFRFGQLYASLGLTTEQIDQFETLMSGAAATSGAFGPNGQQLALKAGPDIPEEEIVTRLHALLGEEGFQQFQKFGQVAPARDLTVQVASDLSFTDSPLTPQQAEQLQQILAGGRAERRGSQTSRFDRSAVIARAKSVLSAPQLVVLDGALAKTQLQQTINHMINASGK